MWPWHITRPEGAAGETSAWWGRLVASGASMARFSGSVPSPHGTVPGTMSSTGSGAGGRAGTCSAGAPCGPATEGVGAAGPVPTLMATQVPRILLTAPTLGPMMSDIWASVSSSAKLAG